MLVASFILGLGVVGVASLMVASSRLGAVASADRDAAAVASAELEIVRSLAYETIGIATTAEGYVASVDDRPTVTESGDNVVEPVGVMTLGDTDFELARSVVWASVGSDDRAYKIVTIDVSWMTSSGVRSVTVRTGLHEGSTGV